MSSKPKVHLQFPRKRKSLSSLTQLLPNPVPSLQQSINKKLFPQNLIDRSKSQASKRHTNFQRSFQTSINFKSDKKLQTNPKTWYPKSQPKVKQIFPRFKSLQLKIQNKQKSPINILPTSQKSKSLDSLKDFVPSNKPIQRNFLKKGSRINKQVVANLIRLKIGRQREEKNEKIKNDEIIKMIKLYKGYGQIQSQYNLIELRSSKQRQESRRRILNIERTFDRQLNGWVDSRPDEEDLKKDELY